MNTFPQTLYSINFDYEKAIIHKKIVKNQEDYDEYIDESDIYGYSVITEEEYNEYLTKKRT